MTKFIVSNMKKIKLDNSLGFFIVLIIIILLIGVFQNYRQTDLKENIKYTLGVTSKSHIAASGTKYVNYSFKYFNASHGGSERYRTSVIVSGGKYLVGFSSKNPMNSRMYFEYSMPDSLNLSNIPQEGWDSIPDFVIKYTKKGK